MEAVAQAAQALEPSALTALQLLAHDGKIVLVGDPKQLPATVISRLADTKNLAQSLFERLQKVSPCQVRVYGTRMFCASCFFCPDEAFLNVIILNFVQVFLVEFCRWGIFNF